MSADAEAKNCDSTPVITKMIDARERPLDGFSVRRLLPVAGQRMVGPFIFFDHMGPAQLAPGAAVDVRPHPHINLATVTYLFEGEIIHRDSLGFVQSITPGAINWMTAGRGIVHSERFPLALRQNGGKLHGIQLWVALPQADEETEPNFTHYPAEDIPELTMPGVQMRVLAGSAYGATSPVETFSPLVYLEARMAADATLVLPDIPERAVYVVNGQITCGAETAGVGRMLVFGPGDACIRAPQGAHLMILGGAPLDGPRHIFWNFVSSDKTRLEAAKTAWRNQTFPKIPGDDQEYIPLPEGA